MKNLRYIDGRYLSASEAVWRLFGFKVHGRSHPVENLEVHLPRENKVTWSQPLTDSELAEKIEKDVIKRSKLLAFFERNKFERKNPLTEQERTMPNGEVLPHAFEIKYWEYPKYKYVPHYKLRPLLRYFTWHGGSKTWKRAKQTGWRKGFTTKKNIGRMWHSGEKPFPLFFDLWVKNLILRRSRWRSFLFTNVISIRNRGRKFRTTMRWTTSLQCVSIQTSML